MKYIEILREGERVSEVYLCKTKQVAKTKMGKTYYSLTLQDKTGTVDARSGICPPESIILRHCPILKLTGTLPAFRERSRSTSGASGWHRRENTILPIICRYPPRTSARCTESCWAL